MEGLSMIDSSMLGLILGKMGKGEPTKSPKPRVQSPLVLKIIKVFMINLNSILLNLLN